MAVILTHDILQRIFPRPPAAHAHQAAIWDMYADMLASPEAGKLLAQAGIVTQTIFKQFCAMIQAETGGLTVIQESGAYRASTILRIFGAGHHSDPVSPAEANRIAALPVYDDGSGPRCNALFERVYGYLTHIGKQLGNKFAGDGPLFRGLGLNQLTGRDAHTKMAKAIGCSVEDLKQPINLLKIALLEWTQKNCNKYAAKGDYLSVRKLINGGSLKVSESQLNGLPEVRNFLAGSDSRFAGIAYNAPDPVVAATAIADATVPPAVTPQMSLAKATQSLGFVTTAAGALGEVGQNLSDTVSLFQPIKSNIDALHQMLPNTPTLFAMVVGGVVVLVIGRYLEKIIVDSIKAGHLVFTTPEPIAGPA
ncbi:hypothetical protein [Hyphomicrobium sp.]|uniref:hypothetical protein n=1 Tax=Hyphomicrobium sp. TaxID=82 RepID=UPI001D7043B8|nr:hypothetical protein [Hyphomicrobium sp.]MBY0559883.1 hypothetical protein [Hyphomicrobium sp.]